MEIFYSDGGHGGPYPSVYAAECAARVYVKRTARLGRKVSVQVRRSTTETEPVSTVDVKTCIVTAAIDGDVETVRKLLMVLS